MAHIGRRSRGHGVAVQAPEVRTREFTFGHEAHVRPIGAMASPFPYDDKAAPDPLECPTDALTAAAELGEPGAGHGAAVPLGLGQGLSAASGALAVAQASSRVNHAMTLTG